MWNHLANLFRHSWDALIRATGTTTLGFIVWTLALTAMCWAATVAATWWQLRRQKRSPEPLRTALREAFWPGVFLAAGVSMLVAFAFACFMVRTLYVDHQTLVAQNKELATSNAKLNADLGWRKHNISTTDAVFPNIIYLLQAFQVYRGVQGGKPCVIWFTSPADSFPLASTVGQLSNSVSGCSTFGPFPPGNPDLDADVMDGMIPGAIVLHAPRGDKAADQLAAHLGNQIQVRRSYTPPRTPKTRLYVSTREYRESFVWFQFGANVKWNSERYR